MSDNVPSLKLYFDDHFVAEIPINSRSFLVGRRSGCQLRLLESSVSREHVELKVLESGEIEAIDRSSTNGTLINGKRHLKVLLKENDHIAVGRCSFIFHFIKPEEIPSARNAFWKRVMLRRNRPEFSDPFGQIVILQDEMVTEFDAVSFQMILDQKNQTSSHPKMDYISRMPRLRVIPSKMDSDEEITRFHISSKVFEGENPGAFGSHAKLETFAQAKLRASWIKLPWSKIERWTFPAILILLTSAVLGKILSYQVKSEIRAIETQWSQYLSNVERNLSIQNQDFFNERKVLLSAKENITSKSDFASFWRTVNQNASALQWILFEVLDAFLATEQSFSLEDALRKLTQAETLGTKLPGVKRTEIVLSSTDLPFQLEGITKPELVMLRTSDKPITEIEQYSNYKKSLVRKMKVVEACSQFRDPSKNGRVVLAFTVGSQGKMEQVFMNRKNSIDEPKLLDCMERKVREMPLETPPGGEPVSMMYTFFFQGPTKVTF